LLIQIVLTYDANPIIYTQQRKRLTISLKALALLQTRLGQSQLILKTPKGYRTSQEALQLACGGVLYGIRY
jgi:hypothetical protein